MLCPTARQLTLSTVLRPPLPACLPACLPAVIDNLVKGASGQAIQNMNLLFGLPEETALLQQAMFP
jgi:hypothetical protein